MPEQIQPATPEKTFMQQTPSHYVNKFQQWTAGRPGIFPKYMTGAAPQAALFTGGGAVAGRFMAPLLYSMLPRSLTGQFAERGIGHRRLQRGPAVSRAGC